METRSCLTTIDNPFNPFINFSEWFLYDVGQGYNTCGKIDRLTERFDGMTEAEETKAVEKAIDLIIENDILNIYKKIQPPLAI